MKYDSIAQIIDRLNTILQNVDGDPLDAVGSKIVGCTIVVDDIENFYSKYPLLEEIAELGADLETEKKLEYQEAIIELIKQKFNAL